MKVNFEEKEKNALSAGISVIYDPLFIYPLPHSCTAMHASNINLFLRREKFRFYMQIVSVCSCA